MCISCPCRWWCLKSKRSNLSLPFLMLAVAFIHTSIFIRGNFLRLLGKRVALKKACCSKKVTSTIDIHRTKICFCTNWDGAINNANCYYDLCSCAKIVLLTISLPFLYKGYKHNVNDYTMTVRLKGQVNRNLCYHWCMTSWMPDQTVKQHK